MLQQTVNHKSAKGRGWCALRLPQKGVLQQGQQRRGLKEGYSLASESRGGSPNQCAVPEGKTTAVPLNNPSPLQLRLAKGQPLAKASIHGRPAVSQLSMPQTRS